MKKTQLPRKRLELTTQKVRELSNEELKSTNGGAFPTLDTGCSLICSGHIICSGSGTTN